MPAKLKQGRSDATVSHNIKELVDDWKDEGSIGNSHPKTKKQAGSKTSCGDFSAKGR